MYAFNKKLLKNYFLDVLCLEFAGIKVQNVLTPKGPRQPKWLFAFLDRAL
jgi:hypothetical protein